MWIREAISRRASQDGLVLERKDLQRFWSDVTAGRFEWQEAPLKDRLRASELLGKSQGLFVEQHKVEVSGSLDFASMTDEELDDYIVSKANEITMRRAGVRSKSA